MSKMSPTMTKEMIEFAINELLDNGIILVELASFKDDYGRIEVVAVEPNGFEHCIIRDFGTMGLHESTVLMIIHEFNSGRYIEKYRKEMFIKEQNQSLKESIQNYRNVIDRTNFYNF